MSGLRYQLQFNILTVLELIEKEGFVYLAKKQMSAFHNFQDIHASKFRHR